MTFIFLGEKYKKIAIYTHIFASKAYKVLLYTDTQKY